LSYQSGVNFLTARVIKYFFIGENAAVPC
jgi:hypothetical protein